MHSYNHSKQLWWCFYLKQFSMDRIKRIHWPLQTCLLPDIWRLTQDRRRHEIDISDIGISEGSSSAGLTNHSPANQRSRTECKWGQIYGWRIITALFTTRRDECMPTANEVIGNYARRGSLSWLIECSEDFLCRALWSMLYISITSSSNKQKQYIGLIYSDWRK